MEQTLEQWAARFDYPNEEKKIVLVIVREDGMADMLTNQPLSSLKGNGYKPIGMFRGTSYFPAPRKFKDDSQKGKILDQIKKVELELEELRKAL